MRALVQRLDTTRIPKGTLVDMVAGGVYDHEGVVKALRDVDVAYYLVNSLNSSGSFQEGDREAAWNFAQAAKAAKVRRIIYLSCLSAPDDPLPTKIRSMHEVGDILRESGIQVLEFRSSNIIGAGSLPFEMARALGERMRFLMAPQWLSKRFQPIAIRDVISYLAAARAIDLEGNHIFEIGGPEHASYGDIISEYSQQRGLRRTMVQVPGFAPALSDWCFKVTALESEACQELIESAAFATVVQDYSAQQLFGIDPVSIDQAIADALRDEDHDFHTLNWSRRLSALPWKLVRAGINLGNRTVASQSIDLDVPPEAAFTVLRRIGGADGWHSGRLLFTMCDLIDRVFGAAGVIRNQRSGDELAVGDIVDTWRVERIVPNQKLTFVTDRRARGRAWVDFEIERTADGCRIRQSAIVDPKGHAGLFFFRLAYPLHRLVLSKMLKGIAAAARQRQPKQREMLLPMMKETASNLSC